MDQMRRLEFDGADGVRIVADAIGDDANPPVVFLHGGGQTRHSWRATQRDVASRNWYAVSVDLRGHGDSDWSADGDYSRDAFARDVIAVAEQLGQPPVLVGASLGGTASLTALGATSQEPVGRALVLVDVAPDIDPAGAERIGTFMAENLDTGFGSLEEVADAVQRYNPHRRRPTDLSGLRKNVRQREDGRWYWHWDPRFITSRAGRDTEPRVTEEQTQSLYAACRSLTVPVLLVRGRQSDVLTESGARSFLDLVPHAQYADVGGAGHMVAGDRNDAFTDAVLSFLDSID